MNPLARDRAFRQVDTLDCAIFYVGTVDAVDAGQIGQHRHVACERVAALQGVLRGQVWTCGIESNVIDMQDTHRRLRQADTLDAHSNGVLWGKPGLCVVAPVLIGITRDGKNNTILMNFIQSSILPLVIKKNTNWADL